jgi:Zn-dependent membrane protease YugP
MAALLIVLVVVLGLSVLPHMWVTRVIARHSRPRTDLAGTGAEFARHVLDGMKLQHVKVEVTKLGDHYDPDAKAVRLTPQHHGGRSLAAIVIAAHEVGHAMQDATRYAPLLARTRMARQAQSIARIGSIVMLAAPLVLIVAKAPQVMLVQVAAGVMLLGSTVLMHAVTLPVEHDASFRRALPLLEAGRYIPAEDMPAARQLLRAAAFTYVAAAAMSLLDVMRWFRMLRI